MGLNFASPTALTLNADVTVNTSSINGTATAALQSLNATALTQSGTANASVNLDGTTTVSGVTVTLPSGLHALASLNSGATFDLFASPTLTASDNFTAAGIKTFALVSASEMLAHFSGFADFLGVFDSKALSFAIPLSASGTTFGDMLNLKREFSENFLSLVQTQSLTTSTLVSSLNNGGGLRFVAGDDFRVTLSNGTMFNVDLTSSDTTLGQVISKIQTASGSAANGTFEARIDPRSGALALSDRTGGGGTLKVEALNQSFAARDLDLLAEGTRQLDENTLADAGANVTVSGFDYATSRTPTLKFTAAVTLGGSGDALTEAAALFSAGALNGVTTTGGSRRSRDDGG